ncbi:MAG TPA: tetratricopeptide repeat protein [Pyrinomonadaceae bacterium]
MAKYKKKRARELQHDKFRDTAGRIFDRVTDRLEGRGKAILYALGGALVLLVIIGVGVSVHRKHTNEALQALGRGIEIMGRSVSSSTPPTDPKAPSFASEQERAQKAIEEFQKVAAKYGDPYKTQARYLIGTNLFYIDRQKAINELTEVSKASVVEPATLAKFALAQAKEADGKYDEAAKLYSELAALNSFVVTPDTANLYLAGVYEKRGKKKEAADLLFNIVDASRKAKDQDGTPLPPSAAAGTATEKLQKLDPDRYAKLTPEAPGGDNPF